jgi:outer membrane protein
MRNFLISRSRKYSVTLACLISVAASPLAYAQTSAPSSYSETLQDVLASVYRSNPVLQAERARLREVDETYIQARAQGRPQLTAGAEANYTWNQTPETGGFFGFSGGEVTGAPYSGQVSLVQPIYQGGRLKALRRQAKASILAARAGLENAENNIFLSAANAYVDVLRDEETARIRRNNVMVLTRQLTASNARFEVGEGTRTDIAQSQSRLAAAEAGLAQADAQLAVSRAQFVRIVGRSPQQLAPAPDFVLPPSLEAATALARENNPQLMAAYYNELAGEAGIDVAKSASRPSLTMNGSVLAAREQLQGISETDQAAVGLTLSMPIFSGGLNKSRVRQAKHVKTRLAFLTRDTERAVDQTVAQIWAQMEAAKTVVSTSRRQVDAAEIAFEGVTLEQQVGTRDQLDVLNAEQEVLNAKLNLVNAERNYDSAVFQLLSVIGVMDAEGIALPIESYDPTAYLGGVAYDGLERAVDRFVPEAVQKIAPQLPNLVVDPAELVLSGLEATEIDDVAASFGEQMGVVGQIAKESVDLLTAQTPAYDPRLNDPDPTIDTAPFGPVTAVPDPDIAVNPQREDVPIEGLPIFAVEETLALDEDGAK